MGVWKSIDELEENISIQELVFIIDARRLEIEKQNKFLAILNGAKFDDEDDPVKQKIREVERQAQVRMKGELEVQKAEFADLGFGYEVV